MLRIAICALALCSVAWATPALAAGDPSIRFYKINKKGQQRHLEFTRNTHETGCRNFIKKAGVHRVALVRFAYCQVHTEKDCAAGSAVMARWEGKDEPTAKLTPGSLWLLSEQDNIKLRSWNCVNP